MAKAPAKQLPLPRINLSVQTLRVAYEALQRAPKPNAQAMFYCAQAMAEIEAVLAALPDAPKSAPTPDEAISE